VFSLKKESFRMGETIEDKVPNVQVFTNKKPEGQVLYIVITGL